MIVYSWRDWNLKFTLQFERSIQSVPRSLKVYKENCIVAVFPWNICSKSVYPLHGNGAMQNGHSSGDWWISNEKDTPLRANYFRTRGAGIGSTTKSEWCLTHWVQNYIQLSLLWDLIVRADEADLDRTRKKCSTIALSCRCQRIIDEFCSASSVRK